MTQQTSKLPRGIEEFEEDSKWFYKNVQLLREKNFTGKFVAIKNKEVMASDKDINNIIKEIEKQGENPSYVLIEFVYPEGTVILL